MKVLNDWLLTPERVAVHLPSATAVVADLHLGYQEMRRQSGEAVPLTSLRKELAPLWRALKAASVQRLVIAGDLFERKFLAETWEELQQLLSKRKIVLAAWIPGNHDRFPNGDDSPRPGGRGVGGEGPATSISLDGWEIVHGDEPLPRGKVVLGHWHPSVRTLGRKRPCYLVNGKTLVLPAYSADAAGVNVWHDPRWRGFQAFAIVRKEVLPMGKIPGVSAPPKRGSRRLWSGRLFQA
ncbi:MAG: metallophosphoesterase [Gemmataceae bacterium]|nr:metallophosphoesterase [Gemmataceae bacterium]